jgi:actin-related protein
MDNVMVTGGNTITPYFNTLVKESFGEFAFENSMNMEISTTSSETACNTSWIGGAILGSLLDFNSFYITK